MFEIAFSFPMNYISSRGFLVLGIISEKMKISFPMLDFLVFGDTVPKISYDRR